MVGGFCSAASPPASVHPVTGVSGQGDQPPELDRLMRQLLQRQEQVDVLQRLWAHLSTVRDAWETSRWTVIGRQVGETMDLVNADIEAYRARVLTWAEVLGKDVRAEAGVATAAAAAGIGGVTAIAVGSVPRVEDVSELSSKAASRGVTSLSYVQVLILVLIWLLTIGAPVLQSFMPAGDQAVMSNEYVTIAVGVALTATVLNRKG